MQDRFQFRLKLFQIASFFLLFAVIGDASRKVTPTSAPCKSVDFLFDCKRLQLTEVPKEIPATTINMTLDQNSIRTLKGNFSMAPNLRTLSVAQSGVITLDAQTLKGLKNLTELRLNNNNIKTISGDIFVVELRNLEILDLSYNKLTRIGQHDLDHLVKLKDLHLDHNSITYIHAHAFTRLKAMEHIGIEYNQLATALPGWFRPINSSLLRISLHHNLWLCDCRMLGYKNWTALAHKKFNSDIDITCKSSKMLKNIHLKELCPGKSAINVTQGSAAIMSCPDVKSTKWNFHNKSRGIFNEITRNDRVTIGAGKLIVQGIDPSDAGSYCCNYEPGEDLILATPPPSMYNNQYCYTLKVLATAGPPIKPHSSSTSSTVVVVILVVAVMMGVGLWYFRRKRRNYGLLSDETVFQPTYEDLRDTTHISPTNNESGTGEAYV